MINIEIQIIINAIYKNDDLHILMEYDEEFFENPDCRKLFKIINELYNDNIQIDLPAIFAKMKSENINLSDGIIDNLLKGHSSINFKYLIDTLEKRDRSKSIMAISKDLYLCAKNGSSYNEFIDKLHDIESARSIGIKTDFKKIDNDIDNIFQKSNYIRTGITHLDEKINGFFNGQLVTMAGRPGGGKTTLALNIMYNIKSCIMFSLEMKFPELYSKMLSAQTDVESWKIEAKKLNDFEKERVYKKHFDFKSNYNIAIYDHGLNIDKIRAIIRKEQEKYRMFFIDYLQLIPGGVGHNRNEVISSITFSLKNLAHDINKPIVLLSQLNREGQKEKRRPELSDLRDSGSIEQDSDVVLFCHENKDKNFELIIGKNRKGRTCIINGIQFVKSFSRFDDEVDIKQGELLYPGK